MDTNEIHAALRQVLTEVVNRELPELTDDVRLFGDLGLDSTNVIELLMTLEDNLDLQIDPDELTPEMLESVGTLTAYIRECLAQEPVG
ncbi:acyl carrier protein [Kibdelosporangium lantanae]|uniref:Acyl carrier protein n=1 Tax=Kibdelosporangium lantanae TaxID=1497396 RepID=A0ABW3MN93_9PSEU